MKKIYLIKLSVFEGRKSHVSVAEYAVAKETANKVYYYDILDNESTDTDIKSVNKKYLEEVLFIGNSLTSAKIWCFKEDKEASIKKLQSEIRSQLEKRLNNLNSYEVTERSYIRV